MLPNYAKVKTLEPLNPEPLSIASTWSEPGGGHLCLRQPVARPLSLAVSDSKVWGLRV